LRIGLYFHTLRYLKLKQIFFQVFRRVYRPTANINIETPTIRSISGRFTTAIEKDVSLVGAQQFQFYGEAGDLQSHGWNGSEKEKLWRYNQHYFDDLNGKDSPDRNNWHRRLLSDWLLSNPRAGSVGWEPYPLSLRIVNWIKWDLAEGELSDACRKSLYLQGLTLEKNVEHHILGNHLLANAKALVFLGCYFEGVDAKRWFDKACKIIAKELKIQVLNDGGNYELSPMYHCIFLEDVLDLLNVLGAYRLTGSEKILVPLVRLVPPMLSWMREMTFDDGGVSCFNDSATNIAARPADITKYAARLGIHSSASPRLKGINYEHLIDSGYIVITRGELKIVLDVARLGPDYLLAHAHADNLSFEMSIAKQRIFVNSGTSCYGSSVRREFERSTRAHNSVEIDKCSSSEVWSTFRVARRAYPIGLKIEESPNTLNVLCAHTGYRRLAGSPVHMREWLVDDEKISIKDKVTGIFSCATSRLILHADVMVRKVDAQTFILVAPNNITLTLRVVCGAAMVVGWRHTTIFGRLSDTSCIEIDLVNGECSVEII
jgi:uncharacterized heparinase superfamily protein